MSINFEDMGSEAPSDEQILSVSLLSQQAVEARETVEQLEQELKAAKETLRRLLEDDLPTAMQTCGMESFKLADGRGVKVEDVIQASPRVADRAWCYDWLREHGFGDLVKNEIVTKFGAGDEEMAEAVMHYLEENHFDAVRKATVHPQTLSAQVRRWLRGDEPMPVPLEEFPMDKFGVFQGRKAKID